MVVRSVERVDKLIHSKLERLQNDDGERVASLQANCNSSKGFLASYYSVMGVKVISFFFS